MERHLRKCAQCGESLVLNVIYNTYCSPKCFTEFNKKLPKVFVDCPHNKPPIKPDFQIFRAHPYDS